MKFVLNVGLNTIYQIGGRLITATAGLIVTRLITQNFGLDGYGQYQIIITYVTLFWILTDFGFNAIAVREMASNKEHETSIYSSLAYIRVISGISLVLIALVLLIFFPYTDQIKWGICIASISIFFQSMMGIGNVAFQIRMQYSRQLISNLLGSLVSVSLVYATINFHWGVIGLAVAFLSGSLVMGTFNLFLSYRLIPYRFTARKTEIRELLFATIPFGMVLLFSLLTSKIDAILLSILPLEKLTNSQAVGIYNLAYKLFELILIIPSFFLNVLYPILISKAKESFKTFKLSTLKTLGVLISGSLIVMLIFFITAPYLVDFLASKSTFKDSIISFRILILSTPLFFVTNLLMWILVIFKKQKALLVTYISAFLFNLISNLIFIPQYHYFAAAINTGLTELLIILFQSYYILKYRNKLVLD